VGAIALWLRVWGIDFAQGLPRGRPDEELFIVPALRMFGASLDPGLLEIGFPEGYAFLLHGALRVYARWLALWHGHEVNLGCIFAVNPTRLLLVGRLLSAALGASTLVPTALTARRLVSPRLATQAGLAAALLLAVDYLHGRDSRFAVTDTSVTFFVAWAVWAFVCVAEEGRTVHAVLAGVFTGLAISIKWIALFLAPVLVLVLSYSLWRHRREDLRHRAVVTALSLLAAMGAFLAFSPHVAGRIYETYAGIVWHQILYDPKEVSRFLLDPSIELGRGIHFHSVVTLPLALGRAGLLAAVVGLAFAFRHRTRAAWICAAVLFFLFGVAVGPVRLLFVRYCMPVIPIFVALAAAGVVHTADWLARAFRHRAARQGVLTVLVLATAAEPALRLIRADELLSRPDTRELAARWILDNTTEGSTVGPESAYTCVYAIEGAALTACNAVLPPTLRGRVPNLPGHRLDWAAEIARGRSGWVTIADTALNSYWNAPSITLHPDFLTRGIPVLSCGKPGYMRGLEALSSQCWEQVARFTPGTPACAAVYDLFDQFYLPYANFDGIERPGPDTVIYRNRCK
jgi:hypothetical protein